MPPPVVNGEQAPWPRSPLQRAAWRYGHMWGGVLAAIALELYVLRNLAAIIGIPISFSLVVVMCWHLLVMITAMETLLLVAGEMTPGPQVLSTRIGRWVAEHYRVALLPTWVMEVLAPFALIAGMA